MQNYYIAIGLFLRCTCINEGFNSLLLSLYKFRSDVDIYSILLHVLNKMYIFIITLLANEILAEVLRTNHS